MKNKFSKLLSLILIMSLITTPVLATQPDETLSAEGDPAVVYATGINLAATTVAFTGANIPAKMIGLFPEVTPGTATDTSFSCESANEDVAIVNEQGVISPKGFGKTVVTVTSGDGKANAECNVSVYVTGFNFVDGEGNAIDSLSLKQGETYTVDVAPTEGLKANDMLNVCSRELTGVGSFAHDVYTATQSGQAQITVTLPADKNNNTKIEKSLAIKVYNPVTAITTDKEEYECMPGSSVQITASANKDADNKTLSYRSDNKEFSVDATGKVTLSKEAAGEAIITISATDGSDFSKTVKVKALKKAVEKIDCDVEALILLPGETAKIAAKVSPADATVQTVAFTSSSDDVTVDKDGNVAVSKTAKDQVAVITVSADDVSVSIPVTVKTDTTGEVIRIETGAEVEKSFKANIDVSKARVRSLDESIAKVTKVQDNKDGSLTIKILAVKEGQCGLVITYADKDKVVYNYSTIVVTKPQSVTPDPNPAVTVQTPDKVAGIKAKAKGKKIKVSFKAANGAFKYEIQYAKKKNFKGAKKKTISKTSASIKVKKGTWYVRVRAISEDGKAGKWSKKVKTSIK